MGRVLVVEDDHAICEIMCEALRDSGHAVECVNNDQEAYERIAGVPTLEGLVLDVNLGKGTTGFDVARFARQVIPDLAVVYVSGEAPQTSFKAFGVPESVFLPKPFSPGELVEAVTKKLCDRAA
ncbi:response regulator [Phenylobacterium sp. LjRoot225]|uniref:response regulator n=1 Tax=Phenylobacterium sp. LjRoot225 TaxID=3342285 RepID=UPI003ECE1CEB